MLPSCTRRYTGSVVVVPAFPRAMDLFLSPVVTLVLASRSSQCKPAFHFPPVPPALGPRSQLPLHVPARGLLPAPLPRPSPLPSVTLTLPFLAVSPTAAAAPRITRSNSIPTHDSTFELYSTSQLGSTLSLADKSKGMIRSGSFRDPVDDGESAVLRPRWKGLLGGDGAPHTLSLLVPCVGLVHPVLSIRAGDGSPETPLCWVTASPDPMGAWCPWGGPRVLWHWEWGGPKQPRRVTEPPGSAGKGGAGGGSSTCLGGSPATSQDTSSAEQPVSHPLPPLAPAAPPLPWELHPCPLLCPAAAAPGVAQTGAP